MRRSVPHSTIRTHYCGLGRVKLQLLAWTRGQAQRLLRAHSTHVASWQAVEALSRDSIRIPRAVERRRRSSNCSRLTGSVASTMVWLLALLLACSGVQLALADLRAATARTVRVGASASAAAKTIAAGVALIPPAQLERWTLEVEPGTYRERVWINASMGPLTLTGLGPPEETLLIYHCAPTRLCTRRAAPSRLCVLR
jgi:hypothetical protein